MNSFFNNTCQLFSYANIAITTLLLVVDPNSTVYYRDQTIFYDDGEEYTTNTPEMTTTIPCALVNPPLMGTTIFGLENGTSGSSLSTLKAPWGITVNSDDSLLIGDNTNNRVLYVAPNATTGQKVAPSSGSLYARRAYFDSSHLNLYVVDCDRCQMTRYFNGSLTKTIVFSPSCGTNLTQTGKSASFVIDSNGSFYVADNVNHRIMLWPVNATVGIILAGETNVSGNDTRHFRNPQDIVLDESAGVYYIADTNNHRILRFFMNSSDGTVVAGGNGAGTASNQLYGPCGLYFSKKNNTFYIADTSNHRIVRWCLGCSEGVTVAGSCNGASGTSAYQLTAPTTVTMDKNEAYLYVADRGNNRIQRFDIN
ncbi:unnamed protein product [Adineta ricciae]|uniref:NHL repeat protein n=1 Tax=Adineta ricciae TaxID=249248 RepID=A0A815JET1_ADIRI|nr:unnamed protein product [Adineta ricciae]CAF1441267.1 unnamed protein product [Adineta ricciae]